jgi:regulatory protein
MRAFAYRLLGRREYSVFELARRVRQKWPHAEGVDDLVAALIEENLLSDERFTESFVRSRVRRHQGPVRIQAELRARGVSDALIALGLEPYQDRWLDLAAEWLARHHPGEVDFAARAKLYRKLVNRGFTHDQAMDALD